MVIAQNQSKDTHKATRGQKHLSKQLAVVMPVETILDPKPTLHIPIKVEILEYTFTYLNKE